jgi:hypothetical protein
VSKPDHVAFARAAEGRHSEYRLRGDGVMGD